MISNLSKFSKIPIHIQLFIRGFRRHQVTSFRKQKQKIILPKVNSSFDLIDWEFLIYKRFLQWLSILAILFFLVYYCFLTFTTLFSIVFIIQNKIADNQIDGFLCNCNYHIPWNYSLILLLYHRKKGEMSFDEENKIWRLTDILFLPL